MKVAINCDERIKPMPFTSKDGQRYLTLNIYRSVFKRQINDISSIDDVQIQAQLLTETYTMVALSILILFFQLKLILK